MGLPWYRVHTVVLNDRGRLLSFYSFYIMKATPVPLMRRQGVIVIFHVKYVILTMSVYRLSLHERMVGNRNARSELLK